MLPAAVPLLTVRCVTHLYVLIASRQGAVS